MNIGEKLLSLRKKEGFTQEELAEKLNVSRQTISKWELNETSPDLKQAKEISKIFKTSIDELIGNKPIPNNNVEKLAGIVILVLKGIGIIYIIGFILMIISFFLFSNVKSEKKVSSTTEINCQLNDSYYTIINDDGNIRCDECKDLDIENKSLEEIEQYFISNNGSCN